MLMTATITRIAHKDAPCGYAATVPKILAKSTCCDSQPLATDPRHECSQRVHNYGQKPRIAPSRSPKPLSRRGSLLPRTSENSTSTHFLNRPQEDFARWSGRGRSRNRERGRSSCWDGHTMSPHPHCGAYPDERNQAPLQGGLIPSCLRADGRSAAQPVGNFVTNAATPSLEVS